MSKYKPKKGIALLLVMAVIVVVLTTVSIAATVLLNNLDAGKGQEDTNSAVLSAQAGIEKVRGYYKNDSKFFDGCSVNDCIDFTNNSCTSCDATGAIFIDGSRRYKVAVTNINATGVSLNATGYKGLYNRSISDGIKFSIFTCGDALNGNIEDGEGNEYPTVDINGQCWMATSLRTKQTPDGTCINGGGAAPCDDASPSDNGQGRACYDNDENSCIDQDKGALYTWDGAMNGELSEGARGICPENWHIPSDYEWVVLETFLTDPSETCDPSRSSADKKVKYDCVSAGTQLSPDGSTGFNGVLTGYRDEDQSSFLDNKAHAKYWSSTGSKPIIYREIEEKQAGFGRDETDNKTPYSFAVRCLKD